MLGKHEASRRGYLQGVPEAVEEFYVSNHEVFGFIIFLEKQLMYYLI